MFSWFFGGGIFRGLLVTFTLNRAFFRELISYGKYYSWFTSLYWWLIFDLSYIKRPDSRDGLRRDQVVSKCVLCNRRARITKIAPFWGTWIAKNVVPEGNNPLSPLENIALRPSGGLGGWGRGTGGGVGGGIRGGRWFAVGGVPLAARLSRLSFRWSGEFLWGKTHCVWNVFMTKIRWQSKIFPKASY